MRRLIKEFDNSKLMVVANMIQKSLLSFEKKKYYTRAYYSRKLSNKWYSRKSWSDITLNGQRAFEKFGFCYTILARTYPNYQLLLKLKAYCWS